MGHLVGKEIYKKLGDKIDSLPFRVNKNAALFKILKTLYTPDEAFVVINMPYGFSSASQLRKATGLEENKLKNLLATLSSKGLVIDIWIRNGYCYMPSPLVVGIFELTMMRTGDDLLSRKHAELFYEYLCGQRSGPIDCPGAAASR